MKCGDLAVPVIVNGVPLYIGDIAEVETRGIHFPEYCRMAFLGQSEEGEIVFLIPFSIAVAFNHNGHFELSEIVTVERKQPADSAIPRESFGSQPFYQFGRATVKGTGQHGVVIAAVDGTLAIINEANEIMVGLEASMLEHRRTTIPT